METITMKFKRDENININSIIDKLKFPILYDEEWGDKCKVIYDFEIIIKVDDINEHT